MAPRTINIISICSGTGALDAGLKLALPRARTVCYVENEVAAVATLVKGIKNKWLDDAPIWDDAKTFDYAPWRSYVHGLIGGYPCQPFSLAGRRNGVSDPRHLWPYVEELIKGLKPEFCFFENVAAHLSYGYFDVVRPSLERLGYVVAEGLFSAEEVGAPHERERLYILAYAGKQRLARESRISNFNRPEQSANTATAGRARWDPEPNTNRVDDGTPFRRDRIHIGGNAVVPVVAAKAFCYLAQQLFAEYLND